MIKSIFIILILINLGLSQTGFYGLDGWYHASTLANAGSVGALPRSDSDRINPAGFSAMPKQFQVGIIKYPAGINAQSVLFIKPLHVSTIGLGLRHIGYGEFDAIDEYGIDNGNYSAGDTWLSGTWAQKKTNYSLGATGGVFISDLESYSAVAMIFSTGIIYNYTKGEIQLGASLSNFGVFVKRFTENSEQLPTRLIVSANKSLAHLPLNLNIDFGYGIFNKNTTWRVGGVFALHYNLDLLFGINSNNIDQRTEYSSVKSVLGSSGIGIAYTYNQYKIEIGGYAFGSGGWIYGTGLNIEL